jgi:hypothetical protein
VAGAVAEAPAGLPDELGGGADLAGGQAILPGDGPVRFGGPVPEAGPVLLAETPSSQWSLSVGGRGADRTTAFGVANAFDVERPGDGTLRFKTPVLRYLLVLIQLALWAGLLRYLITTRRRTPRRSNVGSYDQTAQMAQVARR